MAISEIRFPRHNEAVEEGSAVVSRPGEKPKELTYEVTHVKRKAAWKIAHVEETVSAPSNYEHLKELEWLMGEWVDDSEDVDVETLAQWTKNKNFITLSFRVVFEGRPVLEGTQVIGWDPSVKSIKSWVFDSLGGFGQGVWTREGSRWTVRTTGVLITGEKTSAINIYTALDENTFTFSSISRETNGATAAQYRRDQGRSQANLPVKPVRHELEDLSVKNSAIYLMALASVLVLSLVDVEARGLGAGGGDRGGAGGGRGGQRGHIGTSAPAPSRPPVHVRAPQRSQQLSRPSQAQCASRLNSNA